MIKENNGKQSISVGISDDCASWERGVWRFCQNGWQTTAIDISIEQFEMLQALVTNPAIIQYYKDLRKAKKT